MIAAASEVAVAAIFRTANVHLSAALAMLGVTDAKELLKTLDKRDRYKIKKELTKAAKVADTLEGFVQSLTPVQQAYVVMHGRDSEMVSDIASENAGRWRANVFAKAFSR